ncbi:hypothetical protein C0584_00030, partial [Candidatus Parcubacteria bacterium]
DNTKCVYNNGGTIEEYANGYELCNGDSWYKSCSGGVWGAQVDNPVTTNSYCPAQGDPKGGYSLSYTCNSGLSGDFLSPGCTACTNNLRANTTKDDCFANCSTNDDTKCIQPDGDSFFCYSGDNTCYNGELNDKCDNSAECDTGHTCNGSNLCKADAGESCSVDSDCLNGTCPAGVCTLPDGSACSVNAECTNNNCWVGICRTVSCGSGSYDCNYGNYQFIFGECGYQVWNCKGNANEVIVTGCESFEC